MRFHFYALLALSALVFLSSCGTGIINQRKPEKVAIGFAKLFSQLELKKAQKYVTPEGKQILKSMELFMEDQGMDKDDQVKKLSSVFQYIETAECNIEGEDKAQCTLCCDETGTSLGDLPPVELLKIDNKWYVHMSKENFFE